MVYITIYQWMDDRLQFIQNAYWGMIGGTNTSAKIVRCTKDKVILEEKKIMENETVIFESGHPVKITNSNSRTCYMTVGAPPLDKCADVTCSNVCFDGHLAVKECDPNLGICQTVETIKDHPDCMESDTLLDKVIAYVQGMLPDVSYLTIKAALSVFGPVDLGLYLYSKSGPVADWVYDQLHVPDTPPEESPEENTMLDQVIAYVQGILPDISYLTIKAALSVFGPVVLGLYLYSKSGPIAEWVDSMRDLPVEPPVTPPVDKCKDVVCENTYTDTGNLVIRECDPNLGICQSIQTITPDEPGYVKEPDNDVIGYVAIFIVAIIVFRSV